MSETVPFVKIDGVWWSTDSERGKEHAKWNKPYQFQGFPRAMYLAKRRPDGVPSVTEWDDRLFPSESGQPTPGAAEAFSRGCFAEAKSEDEMRKLLDQGWRKNPQEALQRFEEKERAIADAAANRAYHEQFMSEAAQREAAAADTGGESGIEHLGEVPEAPLVKKRGGWPKGKKKNADGTAAA